MIRVGIDIGGTFTDFVVWNEESGDYSSLEVFKVPTTPPNFAEGVITGLRKAMTAGLLGASDPIMLIHGTTISTNAVIERRGSKIGLLTTKGFKDILAMARLRIENPLDFFGHRPLPLIPQDLVFEIDERLLADGTINHPLDEAMVIASATAALKRGAVAVAVCFLHSYRNPVHERRAAELIRQHVPELEVVLSSEIWPQEAEYERASAAVLNAYCAKMMSSYIGKLENFLHAELPNANLLITKSNGGVMAASETYRVPIHTLLSGPAAGVTAASVLGRALKEKNLLTMDMGGTSTDISLIRDGRATISHEGKVGDFPLMMPVTAIEAIGAGGGSIAWMDGQFLKVGPRSAGALPGPACYGRGGVEPTISDAYLVCGYLSDDMPLAGGLSLDRRAAETALHGLADKLSCDVVTAAEGCIAVATSNMLANAMPFVAKLGVDPSELTLMVFGGTGGIHGPLLAKELGVGRIIIPRVSSVFCAFGCLVSDLLFDLVSVVPQAQIGKESVIRAYAELCEQGYELIRRQGVKSVPEFEYFISARYAGQSFEVNTPVSAQSALDGDFEALEQAFHQEHERLFSHSQPNSSIEILSLRLRSRGSLPQPEIRRVTSPQNSGRVAPLGRRAARFENSWHDVEIYEWESLSEDWQKLGPVIVRQETATIVVPPGFTVSTTGTGDLLLQRDS